MNILYVVPLVEVMNILYVVHLVAAKSLFTLLIEQNGERMCYAPIHTYPQVLDGMLL